MRHVDSQVERLSCLVVATGVTLGCLSVGGQGSGGWLAVTHEVVQASLPLLSVFGALFGVGIPDQGLVTHDKLLDDELVEVGLLV